MSLLSLEELKALVEQTQYPCISLYMPTVRAGTEVQQNAIRFKNLIRQAETLLEEEYELNHADALKLLQPAMDLDQDDFWQHQNEGLAIFLSEGFLREYRLPFMFDELVVVSNRFHVKPLMPLLIGDGEFYLLALSQKQVRLFEGTRYGITEIELEDVPTSLDDALQYDETAKDGQFRIGTTSGNPRPQQAGSFHGQGSPDRDDFKADILQFFHVLDQGLHKYLNGKKAPLVLAGVNYLLPIYQEANTYPHLINEIIPVENIGTLKPEDLHQPAWAIVEPHYTQTQQSAIEHYHELAGTGKTSTDLKEVVAGAYYGRVDQLFVAVGIQQWGNFDAQADELHVHPEAEPGDEDLLNAAAAQTVLNGGTVYAVAPEEVPEKAAVAAVFRY